MPLIHVDLDGFVGILTLDNPTRRNALNAAVTDEMIAGLRALDGEGARVVVLRAKPDVKVWSSGHDISELPGPTEDPLSYDDSLERMLRAVKQFRAPVIAMVHGSVWGGACDLALSCDIIIGDPTATFAITPANIGLPYNLTGILQFLSRLPLNVAKEMFFTAAPVSADNARRWNLINHLVEEAELEEFTFDMARKIAAKAPLAVAVIKEQFRMLVASRPMTPDTLERIQGLRRQVWQSKDYEEGIRAFREKRPPRFIGE
jgi:methylmalonyl-CoA decarboxylase